VIDWARIKELYDEIGADAFGDVIDLFVEEVGEGVTSLTVADTPKARVQAFHFLKGAALNLGLTEVAQICALGEQRAGAGLDTDDLADQVAQALPELTGHLMQSWRKELAA
jgi:HPt (histidine-containing phosphotransfer) domain-containing protein